MKIYSSLKTFYILFICLSFLVLNSSQSYSETKEIELKNATKEIILKKNLKPENVRPIFRHKLKGEGVWRSKKLPTLNGENHIFKTWLRVDGKRPFARLTILSIDKEVVDLKLVAGTKEPKSTIGLRGKGVIPKEDDVRSRLICAFNGGFRTEHGKFGFISDGIEYVPPVKGIATIAVDEEGKIHLGTWGKTLDDKKKYIQLRQNLKPLIEDGKIRTKNRYWGKSIDGETNVWRSGIGLSEDGKRIIFAAGNALSSYTLAKGLKRCGCNFAMQLDINDYHTYLIYYLVSWNKEGKLKVKPRKLNSKMGIEIDRCLKPYARDFFYMVWKKELVKNKIAEDKEKLEKKDDKEVKK